MGEYIREAGRLASLYNAGYRAYNALPSWDSAVNFLGGPVHDTIFGVDDGSVSIASSQRDADDAYIRRAMGYRLNPAGLPAPSRSSRSSVSARRRARLNTRAIAAGFSGGGGRRRFSRGGRRRYSGARRGYRRGRSYKRRRVSFGKKVKRQAVRAGMRSNKQYGSICKDLGTMFPECLSVKIFLHFQHPVLRAAGTAETFAAYDHFIRCYPYLPCAQYNSSNPGSGAITPVTGYSDLATLSPMGWSRLIGTSGASSMYRECLVVSMAYDMKLDFNDTVDFSLSDAATNKIFPPARHFYHVFDTQGTAQVAPTDQAKSDTYAQQPDVKMKVSGSHNLAWGTSADTTNTATLTMIPGHRLRWRGSIWPHKAQEIPLDTYIGDKSNWGTSAARPTNFATLQFSGALGGVSAADTSTAGTLIRGIATTSLCFTCLMKTPIAGVS